MIYLLTDKNELRFAKIWAGHLEVVKMALDKNNSAYTQLDIGAILAINKTFFENDVIINFGNHQYLGSETLNKLAKIISKIKRTIFMQDDYQAPPATQLRKAIIHSSNLLLTNIKNLSLLNKRKSLSMFEKVYVNLNKASFKLLPLKSPKYPGSFIYWGSFRPGRIDKFDKYIKPKVYKTFVSTSNRGHCKFVNDYFNYIPRDKFKTMPDDLQDYAFTVYLHDEKAPVQSPANRFYEAISAGLPIFFDAECLPEIENIPDEFIMTCAENIPLNDLKEIQIRQRKLWGQQNYRQELVDELAEILYNKGIL